MAHAFKALALASLVLAACSAPAVTRWERPGTRDTTNVRDASDCSAISWKEAERLHPYGPIPAASTATVDSDWMMRRQQVDNARFADANRFYALCMQSRGYAKVEARPR